MMRLIRVWSLMRSGHHAIINWIIDNMHGNTAFFNNCSARGKYHYLEIDSGKLPGFDFEDIYEFNNVVINFEHKALDKATVNRYKNWHSLAKIANSITDVIVVRDPYNWVASSMSKRTFKEVVDINMGLWRQYAKATLNCKLFSDCVSVKFNSWFISKEYRKKISRALLIDSSDEGINSLATRSSFDGREFNDNAQDMRVLDRWKEYKNNKKFLSYVDNNTVHTLAKQVFGFRMDGL